MRWLLLVRTRNKLLSIVETPKDVVTNLHNSDLRRREEKKSISPKKDVQWCVCVQSKTIHR